MAPTLIDPPAEGGFAHPYYLYVPDGYTGARPILVEPTNTGTPSDEFETHRDAAARHVRGGVGRRIADELGVPLLHPAFPRPVSDPVDWTHSIHQLCARTIRIESGPLARVDRQLLAMIDDARARLADQYPDIPETVMLTGFSASATFANRFSVLHPTRVASVSAGGVNGMVTLPITEPVTDADIALAQDIPPNYPVGVADVEALTGQAFNMAAFREVPQFVYMGEDDTNDTLLWPDAWTDPELRASAILTYGPDIHADRFPQCASVYGEHDISAIFREYPGTGHDPSPAIDDIVTFHAQCLSGTPTDAIGELIGGCPV